MHFQNYGVTSLGYFFSYFIFSFKIKWNKWRLQLFQNYFFTIKKLVSSTSGDTREKYGSTIIHVLNHLSKETSTSSFVWGVKGAHTVFVSKFIENLKQGLKILLLWQCNKPFASISYHIHSNNFSRLSKIFNFKVNSQL